MLLCDWIILTPSVEFADVLEQFESQFYAQALQKFQTSDFTAAGFSDVQVPIQQFQAIMSDEQAHDTILQVSHLRMRGRGHG